MKYRRLEKEIEDWKERGAISTPLHIVDFMIDLAQPKPEDRILDPGCGFGNFFFRLEEKGYENIEGIELNENVIPDDQRIVLGDFLLHDYDRTFDLVIGNPPYGIPAVGNHYPIRMESDLKEKYRRRSETWKGKYNLYALFIEKAVRISNKVCFIVPSTWLLLDEFSKLRKFLSRTGHTSFYHLGKNIFKSIHVDVGIILHDRKKPNNQFSLFTVDRSFHINHVKSFEWYGEAVDFAKEKFHGVKLSDIFNICISIRSNALKKYEGNEIHYMVGKNVLKGKIIRDDFSGKRTDRDMIGRMKKEYLIVPRLVLRHTSPFPICAVETEIWPYTGDVYHLTPKKKMNVEQMKKICDYLNSEETKKRFEESYRNIIPHVMKWQIENYEIPEDLL